ncbi:(2Fe-2S)-binding protein [Dermatobacter hominis]|uniref:(2Fe-2S)-binding protein n=1 Tax=Dermatobacter hominis TaxID=2884263 RepID=UPI001D1097D5|nr:(2Fe-2S)-binding protein [Dermatobacter hominis]UDY35485.1 (2Fe-2S)-binding protein [Dermatobacter hominis]
MTEPTSDPAPTGAAALVLQVNGHERPVLDALPGESLLFVLRERLGLPAAKGACEQGECGSCSVLLDGALVCSCLVLAEAAAGRDVVTVEGLVAAEPAGTPAPPEVAPMTDVQRAFLDEGAVQCGFCTPGLVMAVHDLLDGMSDDELAEPDEVVIREAISGNLCRCTGYGRIVSAVTVAARRRAGVA